MNIEIGLIRDTSFQEAHEVVQIKLVFIGILPQTFSGKIIIVEEGEVERAAFVGGSQKI